MSHIHRIWYQSFLDPELHKNYIRILQAHLDNCADHDFKFEVHGMHPADTNLHPLTETRCTLQTIKNALQAEREGYSAFIIGHFQEPGINEIKACVDIPVIGLGETSMLYACTLGHKIGLVTINPIFIPWHENQVRHYGLQERITKIQAIDGQVKDFETAFGHEDAYQKLLQLFADQMRPMTDQGIEVLIPAGGLPMLLFAQKKQTHINQAVVLDGIAVSAKAAETAVKLKKIMGLTISRANTFKKAQDETIAEFLNAIR